MSTSWDQEPEGGYVASPAIATLEEILREVREKAWGEGYGAGWNDCLLDLQNDGAKSTPNPYRRTL